MNSYIKSDIKGLSLGVDVGSTTVKVAVLRDGEIVFSCYERHRSDVRNKTVELLKKAKPYIDGEKFNMMISGSSGLGIANDAGLPFIQEVFATGETVRVLAPDTNVVIELGGEDAKVIFFSGITDERMNGTCAGGTGAFIDQMATLLDVDVDTMDELSLKHTRIYPIASRCGVFAKTDVQPLINQGAKKEDIAASIYQAVVNQTIAGLAQGYDIKGKVMFLGGPLYYNKGLRERFVSTLNLSEDDASFPEYATISVALGAALYALRQKDLYEYDDIIHRLESIVNSDKTSEMEPLFATDEEYDEFKKRHSRADVVRKDIKEYKGNAYLGIDCGSTTTKLVLIAEDNSLLYKSYSSNKGNPVDIIKEKLTEIYSLCGDGITIKNSAVTGYGEELILHAFGVGNGIVETMAHFYAAHYFNPDVDFIIDIGGQDIKCFKIKHNSVDSIMLNEACSSGCGSFIETFANIAGFDAEQFANLGIKSQKPVDLGSRCTVFMNSSVKQAQKDGADISDISAGLSTSVVKNAIYKVIRANSASELGKNIVVQGGTFLNDAVLRSFEKELGVNVIRPGISGLMGAFGAALYAKKTVSENTLITPEGLKNFSHSVKAVNCKGCANNCNLTVNIFDNNRKFISGNKCEKGAGNTEKKNNLPNLYEMKRNRLKPLIKNHGEGDRTVGLPLALSNFELVPLWYDFFRQLGFKVVISQMSTYRTFTKGQNTIPSDTICYPAKLMHGHIRELLDSGVNSIFYPCLTYNFDEKSGDNHYNCPVVAYYSELLRTNIKDLSDVVFMEPFLNLNNENELSKELYAELIKHYGDITQKQVKKAVKHALQVYKDWMETTRRDGEYALKFAKENSKKALILAGRPYHTDPEICHMIDKLASSLGFVVLSEDAVPLPEMKGNFNVLNQWTYHARLYNAAEFAVKNDCELVQLVSFGCGIDAITTDEVRDILERNNKLYTQLKIDEINNLGAVKIRLRSLVAALEERGLNQ